MLIGWTASWGLRRRGRDGWADYPRSLMGIPRLRGMLLGMMTEGSGRGRDIMRRIQMSRMNKRPRLVYSRANSRNQRRILSTRRTTAGSMLCLRYWFASSSPASGWRSRLAGCWRRSRMSLLPSSSNVWPGCSRCSEMEQVSSYWFTCLLLFVSHTA